MLPNSQLTRLNGDTEQMSDYIGKVLLIVNVASRCGFTSQYAGLQSIYAQFQDRGFEVLGFPCNQFGGQEPGSATEIEQFCNTRYQTTFLKHAAPGILGTEAIKWNFTKFLVDRKGLVVRRYGSADDPASIANDIQKALQSP